MTGVKDKVLLSSPIPDCAIELQYKPNSYRVRFLFILITTSQVFSASTPSCYYQFSQHAYIGHGTGGGQRTVFSLYDEHGKTY